MKKIIGIFVMMLLIGTTILPLASSTEKNIENDTIEIISNLPDYFNWRDYEEQDWTTPAKDQAVPKYCGSCWCFAAIGALESVINIEEGLSELNPNLSEQYVLSCLSSAGSCDGGSHIQAFKYIKMDNIVGNNCNGIILESCMPYQADDSIPCEDKCEDWQEHLVPITDYGFFSPRRNNSEDRDRIKIRIMENGPVTSTMEYTNDFRDWWHSHHDINDIYPYVFSDTINHAIVIVGWKDDPEINMGGYWICKNSHGEEWGFDGFFNIEYGSLNIDSNSVAWVEYNPEDYNWPPSTKINGPYYGLTNEAIQFNGGAVGENPPFTYLWDFGDGSTSTEQNPTHTYTSSDEYLVILTVTDENDKSSIETTSAFIKDTNQLPITPNIEGPSRIKKGELCWYNFTFSDPDDDPLFLCIDVFGKESEILCEPNQFGYEPQRFQNYWVEEGDFIVKAMVKDPYGGESDWAILEVSVPKIRSINEFSSLINGLIERFPILRLLI